MERDWPLVREALDDAMNHMAQMRADEGRAMAADLAANCAAIAAELVGHRAPGAAGVAMPIASG